MIMQWVRGLLLASCMAGLVACAGSSEPPIVNGALSAAEDINPDFRGKPRPVVVKVFMLGSDAAFSSAGFADLFIQPEDFLGSDLIGMSEYQLRPGEVLSYAQPLKDGTRYLGAVAAFRDIDKANWVDVYKLPEKKGKVKWRGKDKLEIKVEALSVFIMPPEAN